MGHELTPEQQIRDEFMHSALSALIMNTDQAHQIMLTDTDPIEGLESAVFTIYPLGKPDEVILFGKIAASVNNRTHLLFILFPILLLGLVEQGE